jgi:hypothetical protein
MQKYSHTAMSRRTLILVTQKWWPLLLPLFLFCIPPYTSSGYAPLTVSHVNAYILTHTIKSSFHTLFPVFKVAPLLLVLSIFLFGNKLAKLFSWYVAISYVLIAFLQSISISEVYGLGICTAHLALSLFVALLWVEEALYPRTDLTIKRHPLSRYLIFVPALVAFWEPANPLTGLPDFNLTYLLTSGAGLAFCMITPLYLAILVAQYPNVNQKILSATSVIGILYGSGNIGLATFLKLSNYWWINVLHLPLLIISSYGLTLSIKSLFFRARCVQTFKAA